MIMCNALLVVRAFLAHAVVSVVYGQSDGDLRLVDGAYEIGAPIVEGRAEVYYNGEFGTICDDSFDSNDAQVVCRQLGYETVIDYDYSQASTATGQIWLRGLACASDENRVDECSHDGWGNNVNGWVCYHSEDVYIRCGDPFPTSEPTRSPLPGGQTHAPIPTSVPTNSPIGPDNGDLKLADGSYERGDPIYEGRVEVYYNGEFGTVCDDGADASTEGQVICRQLGYSTVLEMKSDCNFFCSNTYQGAGRIWLDNVQCSGSESVLTDCSHIGWGVHSCTHVEDIWIRCSNPISAPTPSPSKAPATANPTTANPTTANPTSSNPTTANPSLRPTVSLTTANERAVSDGSSTQMKCSIDINCEALRTEQIEELVMNSFNISRDNVLYADRDTAHFMFMIVVFPDIDGDATRESLNAIDVRYIIQQQLVRQYASSDCDVDVEMLNNEQSGDVGTTNSKGTSGVTLIVIILAGVVSICGVLFGVVLYVFCKEKHRSQEHVHRVSEMSVLPQHDQPGAAVLDAMVSNEYAGEEANDIVGEQGIGSLDGTAPIGEVPSSLTSVDVANAFEIDPANDEEVIGEEDDHVTKQ